MGRPGSIGPTQEGSLPPGSPSRGVIRRSLSVQKRLHSLSDRGPIIQPQSKVPQTKVRLEKLPERRRDRL